MQKYNVKKMEKAKELRNRILSRVELSAPWLFTQLEVKTKRDLTKSIDRMIGEYK